jgi:hypothetical protein
MGSAVDVQKKRQEEYLQTLAAQGLTQIFRSEGFEFTVTRVKRDNLKGLEPGFFVELPHQCDSWQIVGEKYGDPDSKATAVALLRSFIGEARQALDKLTKASDPA